MALICDNVLLRMRIIWFDGDALHFDAERYARLREITLDAALAELSELALELLPKAKLTVTN